MRRLRRIKAEPMGIEHPRFKNAGRRDREDMVCSTPERGAWYNVGSDRYSALELGTSIFDRSSILGFRQFCTLEPCHVIDAEYFVLGRSWIVDVRRTLDFPIFDRHWTLILDIGPMLGLRAWPSPGSWTRYVTLHDSFILDLRTILDRHTTIFDLPSARESRALIVPGSRCIAFRSNLDIRCSIFVRRSILDPRPSNDDPSVDKEVRGGGGTNV